jgi:dTDP-glucose pyrophosphorylase
VPRQPPVLCYHLLFFGVVPCRMKDTLGVLLAGGAGERLYPLTRDRAKPAVTFGGMYRIIDITLSNCLNSDLRRVYILTQYKALSLNRHIREGWNILGREVGEFIEVLPPMKRVSDQWYQGTADAVYQNIYSIGSEQPKHVLILSGDHIYKMDYGKMMKQHNDSAADVTLATIQIDPEEVARFGVVDIDKDGRVNGFEEKPKQTDLRSPTGIRRKVSASMGVYLFNADVLIPVLLKDAEDQLQPRFRQRHFAQDGRTTTASSLTTSSTRTRKKLSTGATWARSRLTTKPTWTSSQSRRCSISTTRSGPSAPTSGSIRQPNSCSPKLDAPAPRSIPSFPPAASFPAAQ